MLLFDRIISSISNADIFEPTYSNISDENKQISFEYLGYLDQYSHTNRKVADIKKSAEQNKEGEEIIQKKFTKKISIDESITQLNVLLISQILDKVDKISFNIFELDELLGKQTLFYLSKTIFVKCELDNFFHKEKWINFIIALTEGFNRKVPYHNDVHTADVLQTTFNILYNGNLKGKLKLKDTDLFAVLLSTICHDYKHDGFTNIYHINARSDIAICYNSNINELTIYRFVTFGELQFSGVF